MQVKLYDISLYVDPSKQSQVVKEMLTEASVQEGENLVVCVESGIFPAKVRQVIGNLLSEKLRQPGLIQSLDYLSFGNSGFILDCKLPE